METKVVAMGPVDVSVGHRYRLLLKGERIQRGDQCLNDDCETWSDVSAIVLRCDYNPAVFVPHRRPTPNLISTAPDQTIDNALRTAIELAWQAVGLQCPDGREDRFGVKKGEET